MVETDDQGTDGRVSDGRVTDDWAGVVQASAVVLLVAVLVAGTVGSLAGSASGGHGPDGTDFTYEPMSPEDRQPGATDTRVGTIGQAAAGVETDLETLLELRSVFEEGSWEGCGPASSEVFGIDRDGDGDRYETDESLEENVKRFSAGEDVFEAEFYDEDDFGPSTHLNSDDRVVSIIECVDNPEEPGWYRIDVAAVTGRTPDGEVVTMEDASHYFWICDCEDEAEARETLGPPPSEPEPTGTPTGADGDDGTAGDDAATATPGSSAGDGDSGGDGSGDPDEDADTDGSGADAETAAPTGTDAATAATGEATASPSAHQEWAAYQVRTPTPGSGAGVSPVAAVAALFVAALLARRS